MPSKAQLKRASVRGKILVINIFGKGYGKVVRLKKRVVYTTGFWPDGVYYLNLSNVLPHGMADKFISFDPTPHPRRALIVTNSGKTPVRLRGKK